MVADSELITAVESVIQTKQKPVATASDVSARVDISTQRARERLNRLVKENELEGKVVAKDIMGYWPASLSGYWSESIPAR